MWGIDPVVLGVILLVLGSLITILAASISQEGRVVEVDWTQPTRADRRSGYIPKDSYIDRL